MLFYNLYLCRNQRASFEDNQHILTKKLTDKTVSECRLLDQCDLLQKQLADMEAALESREAEFVSVVSQLESQQRECNEYRMEKVQLTAELKNADGQRDSMDCQVSMGVTL